MTEEDMRAITGLAAEVAALRIITTSMLATYQLRGRDPIAELDAFSRSISKSVQASSAADQSVDAVQMALDRILGEVRHKLKPAP